MTTTKAHQDGIGLELQALLAEAEITNSWERHDYMARGVVDPSNLVNEVVTILGATGGLAGIAAILKTFFSRHKGTTVKFGGNGEVLEASGLSVDDITRLLDRCSPATPPDKIWVVKDAPGTGGSEEPGQEYMVLDKHFTPNDDREWDHDREPCPDRAITAARQRSRKGLPQEVVVHDYGEPRVIRRYEDGHEVPRLPGCPPWCDEGSHEDAGARVCRESRHGRTIGIITLPDEIQVHVGVVRKPDGQDLVVITSWAPPGRWDRPLKIRVRNLVQRLGVSAEVATRLAIQADHVAQLSLSPEPAAQLAELAGLLGLPDLMVHLRNAVVTLGQAGRKRTSE